MNKKPDWDHYFHSHYQPVGGKWGKADLEKYRTWYASWVTYFENHFHFSFTGKSAIELGCGIGAFCSLLADRGCDVTGSDISQEMIASAAAVCPNIPFVYCDIIAGLEQKKKFDYVFAFEVLEHLPTLDPAIENIKKILLPDGWFIGSSPYPYPKNMQDPTHVNVHKPEFWKELFVKHEFRNVSVHPLSVLPALWKHAPALNPRLPFYLPWTGIVSTSLIFAQK